jgi:bacterioferritin-associated ferredoxin
MYICICHEVTDRDIKHAVTSGACSMKELRESLNVGATCGRCSICAKSLLNGLRSPVASLPKAQAV